MKGKIVHQKRYNSKLVLTKSWYEVHFLRPFLLFWKRWSPATSPTEVCDINTDGMMSRTAGPDKPIEFESRQHALDYIDRYSSLYKVDIEHEDNQTP